MLSDHDLVGQHRTGHWRRLNALSSIVCFLTQSDAGEEIAVNTRLNALSSIVCFLTPNLPGFLRSRRVKSQCPLEHCMLSDSDRYVKDWRIVEAMSQCPLEHCMLSDEMQRLLEDLPVARLNALSSIVCFLTRRRPLHRGRRRTWSQCPLEHCMLSDAIDGLFTMTETLGSQCPLEHCMLSD